VNFLLLEDVDQLHLLLYGREQVIYLSLFALASVNVLLVMRRTFLHCAGLELVEGLG
jgi:hypothetical protein